MKKHIYRIAAVVLAASICFASNPKLFFDASDINALKQKRYEPHINPIWQDILARANAYSTASSADYVDPESDWFTEGDYSYYGRIVQSWVETLGFVYQLTGNPVYGNHGAAILAAACDYEAPQGSLLSMNIDMLRTLATGYDWLASAMTPEQKAKIEARAKDYIEWSITDVWGPYHNFMGVGFGGMGLLALAIEDAYPDDAPGWIAHASERINTWLTVSFDEKGAYLEGSSYIFYGFSNGLAFADALDKNKGINLFTHPNLNMVDHFLAMILLPGMNMFEGRNSATYSMNMDVTTLALMSRTDSGLLKWLWDKAQLDWDKDLYLGGYSPMRFLWDNDVQPADEVEAGLPLAEHFQQRGLIAFRSGWGVDDTMFTIESGPYFHVTHNQADEGHFGFYGLGRIWATDTGRGDGRHDANARDQSVGHNLVLINGQGQALSGASWGTEGEIIAYESYPEYGYAAADATVAYNTNWQGVPGVGAEHAIRHSVYVRPNSGKPAYAVVFDNIKKDDDEHLYSWQLLTREDMDITVESGNPTVIVREYLKTPEDTSGTGEAMWTVNIPEAGEYELWGQVRADGESISGSDSFKVQVNDGDVHQWHFAQNRFRPWRWDKVTSNNEPISFNLTAGTHQIKFQTRETGAQLSAVFLTKDMQANQPFFPQNQNGIYLAATDAAVIAPMEFYPTDSAMKVVVDSASEVSYEVGEYRPDDGRWPEFFPRLRANCTAVNPMFISFMMPHYIGEVLPDVSFSDVPEGRKITIAWDDRIDEMVWTVDDVIVSLDLQGCLFDIPGDINGDCVVNFADFAILAEGWLKCSMPYEPSCEPSF